jgi:hypothetical protein
MRTSWRERCATGHAAIASSTNALRSLVSGRGRTPTQRSSEPHQTDLAVPKVEATTSAIPLADHDALRQEKSVAFSPEGL